MTSSYLELLLIITTYLNYKLILRNILWFALNLFFYAGERLSRIRECCELENKRKCTEPERERMSGNLMELNDTDPNYINFGDETDSDNMIRMKTLCFKKACFILNSLALFELLRVCQSEIFCTRKYNENKISNVKFLCFFFFWLKRFCIFV